MLDNFKTDQSLQINPLTPDHFPFRHRKSTSDSPCYGRPSPAPHTDGTAARLHSPLPGAANTRSVFKQFSISPALLTGNFTALQPAAETCNMIERVSVYEWTLCYLPALHAGDDIALQPATYTRIMIAHIIHTLPALHTGDSTAQPATYARNMIAHIIHTLPALHTGDDTALQPAAYACNIIAHSMHTLPALHR